MPVNKNALVRFLAIDSCLRTGRKFSRKKLMNAISERCGIEVSPRTFDKDISDMRDDMGLRFYAPIKYDRESNSYSYTEEGYSIVKKMMDL